MIAFSKRTPEDIYLEYFNDWLTTNRMAENYNMSKSKLLAILEQGKKDHEAKFKAINSLPSLD